MMITTRLLLAVLSIVLVGGCATVGENVLYAGTTGDVKFDPVDVDAAIVIAQQSKDAQAEKCFVAIKKKLVEEVDFIVKGPVSEYAVVRAKVREMKKPLDEDVKNECAPLVLDSANFFRSLAKEIVSLPIRAVTPF